MGGIHISQMTYIKDSTDLAYREYCTKIIGARLRFSQEEHNPIALEFLRQGLDAKEVAARHHLCGAHIEYQWVGRYIEETQIMRQSYDGADDEFKAMSLQEQLQELKHLRWIGTREAGQPL